MTDEGTPQGREDEGTSRPDGADTAISQSVHTGAPQGAARKKSRLGLFLVSLFALLLVGSGAVAGVLYAIRGTSDVLISKVPADSLAYVTVYLDPAAGQKINVARLAQKFPALRGAGLGRSLDELMDATLAGTDMSFGNDIQPWMGSQAALVLVMDGDVPGVALLVDSRDDDAASRTLDEIKQGYGQGKETAYEGATIWDGGSSSMAMVDGTVVFGDSERIVERVIDTANGGESLSSVDAYSDTTRALPTQRLASAFVNGTEVIDAISSRMTASDVASADRQLLSSLEAFRGMGMALSAESDGLSLKFASSIDSSKLPDNTEEVAPHRNSVLGWVPMDSYGLLAGTGLGGNLQGLKDQMEEASPGSSVALDLFGVGAAINSLQGDYGLVVSPMRVDLGADAGTDITPAGAFMMATNDDAAMQDFLDSVSVLVARAMADGLMERTVTTSERAVPPVDDMTPIRMITPTWQTEEYGGATISYLPVSGKSAELSDIAPAYVVSDGMAIIATSPDEAKALLDARSGDSISQNPNFNSAMTHADEKNTGLMFVNTEQILDALKASAGPNGLSDEMSNMEPIGSVVMTSGGTRDTPTATVFILIR